MAYTLSIDDDRAAAVGRAVLQQLEQLGVEKSSAFDLLNSAGLTIEADGDELQIVYGDDEYVNDADGHVALARALYLDAGERARARRQEPARADLREGHELDPDALNAAFATGEYDRY